jgi:hypothetical protein
VSRGPPARVKTREAGAHHSTRGLFPLASCTARSEILLFGQVRLDPEVHTHVWPNGAHFDPAMLHDWPLIVEELAARARAWISTATRG